MQNNLLKQRSRELRKNMTMAEKKLWHQLRQQRLGGIQFRRQVILGKYIVDFIAFNPKIVIEVDGSQHFDKLNYDQKRTNYLESLGYVVLRYWNNEVLKDINAVLNDIWNNCFNSLHPPCWAPSS